MITLLLLLTWDSPTPKWDIPAYTKPEWASESPTWIKPANVKPEWPTETELWGSLPSVTVNPKSDNKTLYYIISGSLSLVIIVGVFLWHKKEKPAEDGVSPLHEAILISKDGNDF